MYSQSLIKVMPTDFFKNILRSFLSAGRKAWVYSRVVFSSIRYHLLFFRSVPALILKCSFLKYFFLMGVTL